MQHTAKPNGGVERALGHIQGAAASYGFEVMRYFPETRPSATAVLWAEACMWLREAFNKAARELFFGSPPPLTMLPFL